MSNLHKPRRKFKPFEYPKALEFKDAIRQSYWIHTEWNFISDVQDYHTRLNKLERNAVKNTLLAISQIEISVKKFWTKLGDHFPKAEFDQVGVTFGESEVRHSDAYSHLLEKLNLNADFDQLLEIPVIRDRIEYLTKYLRGAAQNTEQDYTMNITLFSIFIENISLFGQFVIIKSFNKEKNYLKDIDNVVQATQKEELIHAQFGIWLINQIKQENPDWFNEEFYKKLYRAAKKAYAAEEKIIDWIFEQGELDFISISSIKEMLKDRFNESLVQVGGDILFEVDQEELSKLQWFKDEIYAETNVDFFYKKSTNYSKNVQSYAEEDLF